MKKVLALAITVGLCATALAERHRAEAPTKITGPVKTKTLDSQGGAAGTPVAVYSFTAGNYYFYYGVTSGNGFNWHLEDQFLKDIALGNPYGAWLQDISFGISQIPDGPIAFEVINVWYDTIDYDGSPAGEPVNKDIVTPAVLWTGISLADNPFFPGATLWGFTGNVSTFPGGGIPVTNQAFMYEQAHFSTFPTLHTGIMQGWSSSGTIGSSGDYFFADHHTTFGDMDGTYETTEAIYFGGPPFAANFYMAYTACIPCDTNCDGSVNSFDINGVLAVLAAPGTGCSACSGDCNVDGSVNGFDINAFLDCLGA